MARLTPDPTFYATPQDAADGAFDAPHRLARLYVLIEQALSGQVRLDAEIRKASGALLGRRMRAIHVPPRVVIDNRASHTHTVLEVNGRDRPGLLHDVTAAISEQGLQIASAHVTTYGVRAVDVFYVKDVFGLKVENERKLAALREALLAALDPDQARIVELRYFGGLTIDETAEAMGMSPTTLKAEWAIARAWLRRELGHP